MTLLLKKLEIHGFKSFASPTTFEFDTGITAIIGPNGSGKSNVAEALRWVLGEQQYSNLRGRRTEDIIFAGSDRKAPLGMAEVVLTLDNVDGDLPLEFSEITVARRAYRSGESQYLINGSRVRLKDIQQLTAPLGQSHTIIGQGLVDAVLSQRPEDRRGLFEHAAGIAGLRLRANDAERGLAEAASNAQRLRDILVELEPRVRSLERSARQAREYGAVRDRLREVQQHYYGALWRNSEARIAEARSSVTLADNALHDSETSHQQASQQLASLRSRDRQLVEQQAERNEELVGMERDMAATRHQLELVRAESRSAKTRLADLTTSRTELEQRRDAARAESERLAGDITALQTALAAQTDEFERREQAVRSLREERARYEQKLVRLEQDVLGFSRRIAETEGRLHSLAGQRASLESDHQSIRQQLSAERARQEQCRENLAAIEARKQQAESAVLRGFTTLEERRESLGKLQQAEQGTRQAIDQTERELGRLRSRLEILERTYESGEGLYAGVRALLRAVRRGQLNLPGLRGTLAELIDVPKDYETAIEVALGGHLQDVIVERWSDAETAIAYLKRENAGRATFQPLDTLRKPGAQKLDIDDPGIAGIASALVSYPDDVAPVVEQALNRVLVVDDLDASRRIIKLSRSWTLVTLSGEVTRPTGSVTGGSATRTAGLLARERDRRTLPGEINAREGIAERHRQELAGQQKQVEEHRQAIEQEQRELASLQSQARDIEIEHDRATREAAAIDQTIERLCSQESALAHRDTSLAGQHAALGAELDEIVTARDQSQSARDDLARQLSASPAVADESLSTLRADIAAGKERLRSHQEGAQRLSREIEQANLAIEQRSAEVTRLQQSLQQLDARAVQISTEASTLESTIDEARAAMTPLVEQQQANAPRIAAAERDLDRSIGLVREAERQRDRATLELARCQDEQVFLLERVRNDLEIDEPASLVAEAGETGEQVEKEINRLRDRLRRMSAVGEDVLEEHAAEAERLQYLTSQLEDVEGAAESLRSVQADLNRKMAASFSETFRDVAIEFEQTFKRLFGGGTAKLSQQNEDDEPGGVDIVAQPPGKRLQGLNQLSGGERALTAVALLVAIQRVNPSPFCLLDEVDAALDESNVVRFKDELRDLATSTQFVVITHNRGTIEGADTLYGVTMGDDGISRTVSLRLDEAIRAVEEHDAVTVAG